MSQRRESQRQGAVPRAFSRAGRANAFAQRGENVSMQTANRIMRAADRVKARVVAHHARHQENWTNKHYGDLLQKHGLERAPKPNWAASDPQARFMAMASNQVSSNLTARLDRIEQARTSMMRSGIVRENRKIDWQRGLGE